MTAICCLLLVDLKHQLLSPKVSLMSERDIQMHRLPGWVIFILSPSFYTVERVLPILLNEGCTEQLCWFYEKFYELTDLGLKRAQSHDVGSFLASGLRTKFTFADIVS